MKLLIWGIKGGMSQSIAKMAKEDNNWHEIHQMNSRGQVEHSDVHADVAIDFTHASTLDKVLSFTMENKCPLVIGTTGYNNDQLKQISKAAETVPVLHGANMSLGMNLLFSLARQTALLYQDTVDIEIVEAHHNRKPDAPSGTSLDLIHAIEKGLGEERNRVYGRRGESLRQSGEIGIHSIRGGSIISRHEAWFIHELEKITLSHEAFDNSVFAQGALAAAKFLVSAEPGLYDMSNVLN